MPATIISTTSPELMARLSRLEKDPNLRHTGVRWHAHEAAYPNRGAADIAAGYINADRVLLREIDATLTEWKANDHIDGDDLAYIQWLYDELAYTDGPLPTPPPGVA